MPLICVGFFCLMYGELPGTHPNCFTSWENVAIEKIFYYNTICFILDFGFTIIIVRYLSDQVKGLNLLDLLWNYSSLAWLS